MINAQKFITPAQWICGIIIFALSAAGIGLYNNWFSSNAQGGNDVTHLAKMNSCLIAILILALLMALLSLVKMYLAKKSGASNYDVEQQEGGAGKGAGGQDNQAYEKETGNDKGQSGPGGKWTKNYVPFKGFPKGSSKTEDKENGVEVVNEVGVGGDSSEKKDASEKSDEKWKKNYVPYQEQEQEDSNKQ